MIQFTDSERVCLRERAAKSRGLIRKIRAGAETIYREPCLVPETGIGNWTLYYYCPECSVELIVDRHSPKEHVCPVCKKAYTGEPYNSAWWGFMHMENYRGAYQLALLNLLTGEESYGAKAVELMCSYADRYENYEIHGDIPYNGPGKACAQTLDEAILLRTFAMAYDLVEERMTEAEKKKVKEQFLVPGAEFLMGHRHRQIHNHEVIIGSAIGVIGLLFGRPEFIKAGVYGEYGLLYQLEHGMLPYGVWFEGSFGYHFFALESFFAYEKFARHTAHGHMDHENYRIMLETPVNYIMADGKLPMMNDTTYGHGLADAGLYEFACSQIKSTVMKDFLKKIYEKQDRDSLEALLYGKEEVLAVGEELKRGSCLIGDELTSGLCSVGDGLETGTHAPVQENYHTLVGGPGHTIFRGDDGRCLLFKHDTYGGEHDHYDRLGISYMAFGKKVASDLGTTGYGAKLHYGYYKNTGTHNTVVIGEENQPPASCRLTDYKEKDGILYAEAVCDWTEDYQMPDTFTIVQWKEENYRNVRMTRKIAWARSWFAEMFLVEGADLELTTDWILHVAGTRVDGRKNESVIEIGSRMENGSRTETDSMGENGSRTETDSGTGNTLPNAFSEKKPLSHLKSVSQLSCGRQAVNRYIEDGITTDIYSFVPEGELFLALGPDNPSYCDLNYIIERRKSASSLFLHVVESYQEEKTIKHVEFAGGNEAGERIAITVTDCDGIHKIEF